MDLSIGFPTFLCKDFYTNWVETVGTTGPQSRGDNPSWKSKIKNKNAPFRGRLLMGTTIDYLDTWAVALFATLASNRMVQFAVYIRPAMVCCVDVGFAVIIAESVYIRVMGNGKILIYPMLMPNREIDMEIRGELVILDEFHSQIEPLCVQVESEIGVQQGEGNPHFKFLQIFNVAALIDTDYIESTSYGQLTVQVLEHLRRTGSKPYRIDSVPIHGGLWVTAVRLVYIAVFGAVVAVLTSATHTLFKTGDVKQVRTFEGRPTCNTFAQLDVMTNVKVISVVMRVEFFCHK